MNPLVYYRSAHANNPVVSQTFMLFVIPLPLFATLLLTEEDRYVNVDAILPYFV